MTSQQIRQQFLDFFAAKGHVFVPSSPVVPHDDPTLMFTNAGMNQFKPIFLATARAEHPRVANSQKCIRAGGKHNDLDDVGQDTYHHTFFEMLGNWSFGDYFKKEAIAWAWELLTTVWRIDKSRLHATYFRGDPAEGLEPDSEAAELWRTVTDIDPTHIHPGNKKDNFWEMGDTGPCGPCSEIHIDLTPDKSGRDLVNKGDARVMELWNLVFIQYNREFTTEGKELAARSKNAPSKKEESELYKQALSNRVLIPLPAKHVDTGMGFERLCAVLQKKTSNYDTDVFTPIFDAIRKRTNAPAYTGLLPDQSRDREAADSVDGAAIDNRQSIILVDVSYRVIADHLRCLVFALTDGAIPSNERRGYVLRRILRRAVRYGREYLNIREPFLCDLVSTVVEHMSGVFPELRTAHRGQNPRHVADMIRDEEVSFLKTLDRGIEWWWQAASRAIVGRAQQLNKQRTEQDQIRVILGDTSNPDSLGLHVDLTTGIFRKVTGELMPGQFSAADQIELTVGRSCIFRALARVLGASDLEKASITGASLSGADAFKLYDTYGFPIDLTELMAREHGISVDIVEYEHLMEEARERARATATGLVQAGTLFGGHVDGIERTDDSYKYLTNKLQATVIRLLRFSNSSLWENVPELQQLDVGALILNKTCLYAEAGGQVSDVGFAKSDGKGFKIDQTIKVKDRVLHAGQIVAGSIAVGDILQITVDSTRAKTMQNHTSTHILNWALREVLGEHVQQKGSLVDPEKTRFDFSHSKQLSEDELARIERHVKSQISDAYPVLTMPDVDQKKAREINTLRAVFGEKYPDKVRVVSIGADIDAMLRDPTNPRWMKYSVEFCGGTHLKNSKEAEEFVLVSEEGVAKGVRRVVGVTADTARHAIRCGDELMEIAEALRTGRTLPLPPLSKGGIEAGVGPQRGPYDLTRLLKEIAEAQIPILTRHRLADSIAVLQETAKEHQKKSTAQAQRGAVEAVGDLLASKAMDVGGVTVLVGEVPGGNADALRSGIDYVRNKKGSSGVLLATIADGKVTLVAGMSKDLVDRGIKAGDLIKEICPLVGGMGGGRPDMAQGGGTDPKGLPKALDRAREWLGEKLS